MNSPQWTRYLRLWWRLIALCYRYERRSTVTALVLRVVGIATVPATAQVLRAAVDTGARAATGAATARAAVLVALGVALAYTANQVVERAVWILGIHLTDRVGLLVLDPQIQRDICEVETIDHLERTVHVDRTRDQVKDSPAFEPEEFGRPDYREQVGSYYEASYRRD